MCDPNSSPAKSGLNMALGSLLSKAGKIRVADYLIDNGREKVEETVLFCKVFDMNYGKNVAEAEHKLKEKRKGKS